jgi:hypothetical protein
MALGAVGAGPATALGDGEVSRVRPDEVRLRDASVLADEATQTYYMVSALHSPNGGPQTRIRLFEMEDTGETLRIVRRLTRAPSP